MKDGVTKGTGFLDDYAYLADAALDLYEATGKPAYALFARRTCATRSQSNAGTYWPSMVSGPVSRQSKRARSA